MSPTTLGITGLLVMILLFLTRLPVAHVMAMVGFVGFSLLTSFKGGLNLLAKSYYEVFTSYGLTTIPLFVLMGQLAF
ncbi:MAG TPA: C4-dicarboxylate ABC transporter permease, partial [Desulfomicrobiaceae bacterium]|nr:C4-dicarboxylate ABC transporter permease [Desulfomicrobiaceae bacterium]